jgi:uncharacterized membrane protein
LIKIIRFGCLLGCEFKELIFCEEFGRVINIRLELQKCAVEMGGVLVNIWDSSVEDEVKAAGIILLGLYFG